MSFGTVLTAVLTINLASAKYNRLLSLFANLVLVRALGVRGTSKSGPIHIDREGGRVTGFHVDKFDST